MASEVDPVTIAHNTMTVLSTLNVLQPMTLLEIESELSKYLRRQTAEDVIASLVEKGLIRKLPKDTYIVSQRWLKMSGAASLRKARDKQRLIYLYTRSKRG